MNGNVDGLLINTGRLFISELPLSFIELYQTLFIKLWHALPEPYYHPKAVSTISLSHEPTNPKLQSFNSLHKQFIVSYTSFNPAHMQFTISYTILCQFIHGYKVFLIGGALKP